MVETEVAGGPTDRRSLRAAIRKADRAERDAKRAAVASHKAATVPPLSALTRRKPTAKEQQEEIGRRQAARAADKRRKVEDPRGHFIDQHVTREAQEHGDYGMDVVPMQASIGRDGQERAASIEVVRNRGGTTIDRWQARGSLTGDQVNAIQTYLSAWRAFFGEPRVTASWSLTGGGSVQGATQENVAAKMEAKRILDMIDEEVFFGKPLDYFEVWRNVVLFDEAAGRAGSRLGFRNDGAEAAAKAVVIMIAGEIAIALQAYRRRQRVGGV